MLKIIFLLWCSYSLNRHLFSHNVKSSFIFRCYFQTCILCFSRKNWEVTSEYDIDQLIRFQLPCSANIHHFFSCYNHTVRHECNSDACRLYDNHIWTGGDLKISSAILQSSNINSEARTVFVEVAFFQSGSICSVFAIAPHLKHFSVYTFRKLSKVK